MMDYPLTHHNMENWLRKLGIQRDGRLIKRVVIDIELDAIVKVYVEEFGSDEMFTVDPPDFSRAEITRLPKIEETAADAV